MSVEEVSLETVGRFRLPALAGDVDKSVRGDVLVVGGGDASPGACLLAGLAALRAGAGRLQLTATPAVAPALGVAAPEAAVIAVKTSANGEIAPEAATDLSERIARADAIVLGPGMMDRASAGTLAMEIISRSASATYVLDAAALTGTDYSDPRVRAAAGRLVLTPHAGEMARITGLTREAVEADPLAAARRAAQDRQAVVVMKGADTFIVSPDGRAWRHRDGAVGLATSGSGDVLAGVIGGLLARGASPLVAAVWGVCVHAGAGARLAETVAPLGFLARELLAEIPRVLAQASRP